MAELLYHLKVVVYPFRESLRFKKFSFIPEKLSLRAEIYGNLIYCIVGAFLACYEDIGRIDIESVEFTEYDSCLRVDGLDNRRNDRLQRGRRSHRD